MGMRKGCGHCCGNCGAWRKNDPDVFTVVTYGKCGRGEGSQAAVDVCSRWTEATWMDKIHQVADKLAGRVRAYRRSGRPAFLLGR